MNQKEKLRARCDVLIATAAEVMEEEGASFGLIMDRILTFAAAQAAANDGSPATARKFRKLADNIERGALWPITGEGRARH